CHQPRVGGRLVASSKAAIARLNSAERLLEARVLVGGAAGVSRAGPTGRVSTDGRSTAEAWPVPEWLPRQGPGVVFRLSGDFDPQPWRAVEDLVLIAKFDLDGHGAPLNCSAPIVATAAGRLSLVPGPGVVSHAAKALT